MAEACKTIKTEIFYRSAQFERGAINKEKRTVEMSASSELPVQRWYGQEILDHSAASVDLTRLRNNGALLVDHDTGDQVGVIESAEIRGGKLQVIARFGKGARASEVFGDVEDGIRTLVSIGYRVSEAVLEKQEKDSKTYRATKWMPYEVSFVAIPADPTVGVGRSEASDDQRIFETVLREPSAERTELPATDMKRSILNDKAEGATGGAAAAAAGATGKATEVDNKANRKAVLEIIAIGRQFDCEAEADKAIEDGKSLDEFREHVMEKLKKEGKVKPVDTSPDVGMSRAEVKTWSMVRGLNCLANGKPLEGLEKETNEAMERKVGQGTRGLFIPNEIMHGHPDDRMALALLFRDIFALMGMRNGKRDLSATGGGNVGGYTIQTDVLGTSLIELLRNLTVIFDLGARKLGGLQGDVAIPSQSGGATAFWVDENAQTPASNLNFGQIGLVPHRLSAVTILSKRLLAQSSVDVEGTVREDLARVLAIAIDLAGLAGTGNGGQPLGILNTPGVGSVTFGAAATWAKVLDFETQVSNANALLGSLSYVTTPNTRAKWKAATKIAASQYSNFLWEKGGAPGEGEVNSYRAKATKQIASDKVIFGNFNDLVIADWIGMDVVVDNITVSDKHQVKVIINMLADAALRHAGSFAVSTDSGAQ
jgi:HK97 family phage major capsid protein